MTPWMIPGWAYQLLSSKGVKMDGMQAYPAGGLLRRWWRRRRCSHGQMVNIGAPGVKLCGYCGWRSVAPGPR